jgi:hypothetical protein
VEAVNERQQGDKEVCQYVDVHHGVIECDALCSVHLLRVGLTDLLLYPIGIANCACG